MKSTKIILAMMVGILLVTACKRENKYMESPDNTQQSGSVDKIAQGVDKDGFLLTWPIVRLTWRGFEPHGIPVAACQGGDCGICPGFCFIFAAKVYDPNIGLTADEIKEGINTVKIKIVENQLYMRPDASCDNGDGTVNVGGNYDFGSVFARLLKRKSVIIKKGTYTIRYSGQLPFGEVIFDLIPESSNESK